MPTYLCSKTPKSERSERIDDREEFLKIFRDYADAPSDEVLRFEFNKRYFVEVAHARSEGFFVNCIHEDHAFETLVPYDGQRSGFTIEEFLDDFWNHSVRQKYNFDENVEIRNANFSAKFRLRPLLFFPLLFFAFPILAASGVLSGKPIANALLPITLFIVAATSPYLILLIQHLSYSLNAELSISSREKLVVMKRNGTETAIRFSEITQVRIIRNSGSPLIGHWAYMRIVAGPQKRIIVTDLLYEELERIAELLDKEPVQEPSFYPVILQKKKSAEDVEVEKEESAEKAAGLERRWAGKSKEELEEVIRNAEQYSDFAVEAAKRLLKGK